MTFAVRTVRIVIADDSAYFRTSLARFLGLESDFKIIALAENGEDLIKLLRKTNTDIVLMDIQMPKMSGIEATEYLTVHFPKIKIIILTNFDSTSNIVQLCKLGVKSFVDKKDVDDLPKAIRSIKNGGVYFSDQIGTVLQMHLNVSVAQQSIVDLKPLELEILRHLAKGASSSDIGKIICKSHRTVEDYRIKIYKKFDVSNKEQLLVKAVKTGLLE
jgi:DNA-binding NarL/FixJ family response regulator